MTTSEIVEGYRDGLNPDSPEPSANRSHSYRHSFANGRDDRRRDPRTTAAILRQMAVATERKDTIA
jgi:hypothetical protein